ncbi:MAG: hypothetical protein GQ535_03165 [Rhodobacteraceae bacterium]|nr:hypothetical protein [Paracoccaceae bacterium]
MEGVHAIEDGIKYATNWPRITQAYTLGSILAGAVFIVGFSIIVAISDAGVTNAPSMWDRQELQAALLLWAIASIGWLLGQTILISLPWYLLHTSGRTHWKYAVSLGFFSVPATVSFMGLKLGWGYAGFALWGGIMGWLIWRIAYFKNNNTP